VKKLEYSSAPAVLKARTTGRGLLLPATLLTLIAAGSHLGLFEAAPAIAAPAPRPAAAALAPQSVSTPEPQPAVPAVMVPAVAAAPVPALFAEGADGLSLQVLTAALDAVAGARARGISGRDDLLTVIDYSLPSTEPRLWVLDLARGKVLYHELVAHGSGSGENMATRFSNVPDSRATSLGLFLTGGTYEGGNGYSLKLKGLDQGLNDHAEERHIVMHGAWYVSPEQAHRQGRIGRSWGCPALSEQIARPIIDTIKGGSFIFSYAANANGVVTASSSTSTGLRRGAKS
jgi:L,D-transpeptidase-like protein